MNKGIFIIVLLQFFLPVAQAALDPEAAHVAQLGQEVAKKMGAEGVANIRFGSESAYLADEDKRQLQQLISSARRAGDIKEVVVAAWSDQRFPDDGEILSPTQVDLARARIEAIQTYLERFLSIPNVNSVNMAERTAGVDKILDSTGAATQSALSGLSIKGASRSLVLVYGK
jgi:hypothetical protein